MEYYLANNQHYLYRMLMMILIKYCTKATESLLQLIEGNTPSDSFGNVMMKLNLLKSVQTHQS